MSRSRATYLVPENSPLQSIRDVDQPGVRIAVSDRAAYDLYLTRSLKHAELHRAKGLPGAYELFVTEKLDALAGLVPALKENADNLPGSRVLDGHYTSVASGHRDKAGEYRLERFRRSVHRRSKRKWIGRQADRKARR